MERRGTLEENFEEAGYDPEINYSWGGATLFASGKMDIVHISPLELARLGPERDVNTACVGRVCGEFEGFWTRPGTAYDPDEAGSIQAAVENIIQDNAQLAHGSWAGGNIPPSKIFMDQYGYEYVEGGDFKIATANYTTIPRLLVEEGELDAALTSPMHGGGRYAMDEEMVPIAQYPPWFQENYDFVPPLVNVVCKSDFLDENEDAARAMVQTWDTGMDWLYEQGTEAIQTEDHVSQLGCKTMEGAKYVIEYGLGNDVPFAMDEEFLFQNSFLTDDYIEGQEQFLSTVGERGLVGSNWEDYVEFAKLE
jgi:hypothetical protein